MDHDLASVHNGTSIGATPMASLFFIYDKDFNKPATLFHLYNFLF
jgi:hypothetical protein